MMYSTVEEAKAAYEGYIAEHVNNYERVFKYVSEGYETRFFGAGSYEKHDYSKYFAKEFEPYRKHFYPVEGEEIDKAGYDYSWNLHQKRNPHHWQYWVLIRDGGDIVPLLMPREHILEMICDWTAMSIKFGNVPSKWYAENKDKMLLHPDTRSVVEDFMPYFDEAFYALTKDETHDS